MSVELMRAKWFEECWQGSGEVCNGNCYTSLVREWELERMNKMTKKGFMKYIDSWKQLRET